MRLVVEIGTFCAGMFCTAETRNNLKEEKAFRGKQEAK